MTNLNEMELKVLKAMVANADAVAGGDFGIVEELKVEGLNRKQLGGYMSMLAQKGLVTVYPTERVNGTDRVTQFTIEEAGMLASGAGIESQPAEAPKQTAEQMALAYYVKSLEQQEAEAKADYANAVERLRIETVRAAERLEDSTLALNVGQWAGRVVETRAKWNVLLEQHRELRASLSMAGVVSKIEKAGR